MDLDPVYKDRFGDPLLRLTIDWNDNERKMVDFMIPKLAARGESNLEKCGL
jgi:gluconate 2-dehydrogenase alpha chain